MTDETVELRPAGIAHAALLAGMHAVCFAEPWGERAMLDLLAMPGTAGWLAVDGGALRPSLTSPGPAGLVLWRRALDEAEILTIAVLPPWRGRGLGRRLMGAALDGAAAGGATVMYLEVACDNAPALRLYQHLGFTTVGVRKGYYGGRDALTLRRSLPADQSNREVSEYPGRVEDPKP